MSAQNKEKLLLLPQELNYSLEETLIINCFFSKIENHDRATAEHCRNVAHLSREISKDDESLPLKLIYAGALLHDLGKVAVPKQVLHPVQYGRAFTTDHYKEIKRHTDEGYRMLVNALPQVALVAGGHHFKDGRGYGIDPRGDADVVKALKIIELADFTDAMRTRSDARYKGHHRRQPCTVVGALCEAFPDTPSRMIIDVTDASFKTPTKINA